MKGAARWRNADIDVLRKNAGFMPHEDLAKLLGRSVAAVSLKMSRLRLTQRRNEVWSSEEDGILHRLVKAGQRRDVGRLIEALPGRSARAIQARLHVLGIRTGRHLHDEAFFSKPNDLNCYWAGVLAADADIQEKRAWIALKVARKDQELVVRFKQDTAFSGPIYEYVSKTDIRTNKTYASSQVRVYGCRRWIEDLARNWNIHGRKSLTLEPPFGLSIRQTLAFIVGLIDGDGSIQHVGRQRYLRLQLSGTRPLLEWVRQILDAIAPVSNRRPSAVRQNGSMFDLIITGERAHRVLSVLSGMPVKKLERKWAKVTAVPEPK